MRIRILAVTAVVVTLIAALVLAINMSRGRGGSAAPTTSPSAPGASASASTTANASPSVPGASPSSSPSPQPSPTRSPTPGPNPNPTGVPDPLVGKDIEAVPTSRKVVALTFDAGANADGLPSILSTLAAQHVTATFFPTGDFADRYPASIAAIAAGGHRIGNHSQTHPYFTTLSDASIRNQITSAASAIRRAGAPTVLPVFRFPYGDRDARAIASVNATGYVCVRWTVDTLGWQGTSGGIDVPLVVSRVLSTARPGQIVVMHVGSNPTDHSTLDAEALPTMIEQLRARGYSFVTLDALW